MVVVAGIDTVLGELARLESNPNWPSILADQIKNLQLEFRFLKTFFWCFDKWDVGDARFGPSVNDIAVQLRKAGRKLYAAGLIAIQRDQREKWDIEASNLLERVQQFKPQVAEICLDLLDCSFDCNFSTSYEILDFINAILDNLKHLVISKSTHLRMKILELEEIVRFLGGFVDFAATRAIMYEKLDDFWNHVQDSVNKASCVSFLFWVSQMGETKFDGVFPDLLQKIEPFTHEDTMTYLGVLRASKSSCSNTTLVGEVVASFMDSLFKDLEVSRKDYIPVLREGLMFLIMFIMDPPEFCENLILTEIDAIVSDIASFICSFRVDQIRQAQNEFLHRELIQRIGIVKAKIKALFVQNSDSSLSDFPKVNGLGFLDFLLEKIEERLRCDAGVNTFAKYQIVTIQKELVFLQSLWKLQNEDNELGDIRMQIIKVAYRAEHVIDTTLIMDAPIWHHMVNLSDVIEHMKLIKFDFQKLMDKWTMEAKQMEIPVFTDEIKCRIDLREEAEISSNHVVVGLEHDIHIVVDRLVRGSKQFQIVPIVGMPGIGKTTLAMKVFDSPSVQCHFHKCVWCHVSQVHNRRTLLLNILKSISGRGELSELDYEELAMKMKVYWILKGSRFLVVLDDIWDIGTCREIMQSLPNDMCGSRVLLTSRNLNVATLRGDPHILRPLSDKESWRLLELKLFQNDGCPPELLEMGKLIAMKCKGLPLAIVLVAGVLARTGKDLNFWRQISRSPNSYIVRGCMGIFEYSYKHLPDVLKSCFLYFATFQKEDVIMVKRLVRLWIAEGFIPKSEGKSLEDVANECLMDLISRNLVIVGKRSFSGRIKECHIHDLLLDFCVIRGEEEGFLKLLNTSQLYSKGVELEQYRCCIHTEWNSFVISKPSGRNVHSLLFHPYGSSNEYLNASDVFNGYNLLRVLDLEALQMGSVFPEKLTSLVHLRYLAMTGDFTSIPASIESLLYLETLFLCTCDSVISLPNTIFKMSRLRHVDIPSGATVSWGDHGLEESILLHNLVTFSYLFCKEDTDLLVKMLPNVQGLRFQFYNHFPTLDFLHNLESLYVHKVGRDVGRIPYSYSLEFPSTVRELTLSNLGLPWQKISTIARLPNLEALKLLSRSFEGQCWEMTDDEFLSLKFLKLSGLSITKWKAMDDSLPCLERLVLKNCIKLEEIPCNFIQNPFFKSIEVNECSSSVANSARIIAEEQRELFNVDFQVTITTKVGEEDPFSILGDDSTVLIASVDSVLTVLDRLGSNPSLTSFLADQIKNLQLEFRFLKTFFWCFAKWDNARLVPSVTDIAVQFKKARRGLYAAVIIAVQKENHEKWDIMASNLLERVEQFKPQVAEICLDLLYSSFDCNFSASYEILDIINAMLDNLKHFVISKSIFTGHLRMKITELEEILRFFGGFVKFVATRTIMYEKLDDFWNHVQGSINKASCASFLIWVSEMDDQILDSVFHDLLQKIEPFTPEVTEMYLGVLKASKPSPSDTTLVGEVVAHFMDFLFKNLEVSREDYIPVLREGLMFLIMFLMYPPEFCENLILTQIDAIVSDTASFICSYRVDQIRQAQNEFLHRELIQRIGNVKAKIKALFVQNSDSSLSDFPKVNGLGFLDFLLEKIDERLKCDAGINNFAKYQIVTIQDELVFLQSLWKLQNEDNELGDIRMQIIKVAYRAEHVIDRSSIMDAPIWHHMVNLSDVIEHIKLIKFDFQKLMDKWTMEAKQMEIPVFTDEIECRIDLREEAEISSNHVVVGLEHDIHIVVDRLVRGSKQLQIVPIVGMPGIGKTTLAMKVFDSPSVQYHFHKCVWCHVSQVHNRRTLLLNILKSISGRGELSELDYEELAVKVYRILKGSRFLVVLDDIWDIGTYREIMQSLPDDMCGSRVLLTSRNLDVATLRGDPHMLRPLSDEESWRLLEVKLFQNDVCPPELLEIGKQIAMKCRGIPLAIVLVAGILVRKERGYWQRIEQSLNSYDVPEERRDILELSYQHLPEFLKPCFLYFATFQNGNMIKVKRLVRLWIAEGFIPKTEGKSQEDVANEYLMDLISRNLVIVGKRSFSGGIKECHIHDLLLDFCVIKGEEEGFVKLLNTSQLYSKGVEHEQYRCCIHTEWNSFVISKPSGRNVHSLLFHPYGSSNEYLNAPDVDVFNGFKLLRVLDLEALQMGSVFPEKLTSLVLLRYLAMTGYFRSIPASIGRLTCLETLFLRGCASIIALPNCIWKMNRLRHVDIPSGATVCWDDYDLEQSILLHDVVTFSLVYVSRREDAELLVKMLPNVQRLRFQFYNHFPTLDFLRNIESLYVRKVGRVPNSYSLEFPSMVRELTLSNLWLPWPEISKIAKLPNLEALKLLSRSFEGIRWHMGDDEFLKLKFLKLEGLNITIWNGMDGSLPCLERLAVKTCVMLEEIPFSFGRLHTLKIIEVSECSPSVANSARIIANSASNIRLTVTKEGY